MARPRWSRYARNRTAILGLFLTIASAAAVVLLFALQFIEGASNPYIGILLYLVIPPICLLGLILIPVGIIRSWRRVQRGESEKPMRWPVIDLARPKHRRQLILGLTTVLALIGFATIGSYQGYHYTESVEFCGQACHEVMKPEAVAYAKSPHARVACAECHVGEGADWYVKSKLSGARQVLAVMFDSYSRPIETPIANLRPAQETCERCHWPEKFFGAVQREWNHYMYDEENTHWPVNLLLKVGGGDSQAQNRPGIHWHLNAQSGVEYIARDHERQDIPWVRVTDRKTGEVHLYQSEEDPLTAEEIAAHAPRAMDCMDCHNRPSHVFLSPDEAVDEAIFSGAIPADLPSVKATAVELMTADWSTEDEALAGITEGIEAFYREEHPEVLSDRSADVERAVAGIRKAFAENLFPEMAVRWEAYPNNLGHFYSPGCMRCHSGDLVRADGVAITTECAACHQILSQGSGDRAEHSILREGLEFVHPEDIDEEWRETGCWECHEGTAP